MAATYSSATVPLPHSCVHPYNDTFWEEIVNNLPNLKTDKTLETLEKGILYFFNETSFDKNKYRWLAQPIEIPESLPGLTNVFKDETFGLSGEESTEFFDNILPFLVDLALEMPALFPTGSLKKLRSGEPQVVSLSRKQIACLLSHMFFCTIKPLQPDGHHRDVLAPTGPFTFGEWLHKMHLPPSQIYLQVLIRYFFKVYKHGFDGEPVAFQRIVLKDSNKPDWKCSNSKIVNVNFKLDGRISDEEGEIEVDFANENVGFGGTGTQEELIFGMSPELCPIVLFNYTLADNECILMFGARKIAEYSGYGMTVKYNGPIECEWDWSNRTVIAIDAMCDPDDQLSDKNLLRELNKAYCGFHGAMKHEKSRDNSSKSHGSRPIATGHWGCGVFGGDKTIKAFIQIMAASEAECSQLNFYCFGGVEFKEMFESVLQKVKEKNLVVKDLWAILKKLEKMTTTSYMSSFDQILSNL